MEDHLCDLVLKSSDGAEHCPHAVGCYLQPACLSRSCCVDLSGSRLNATRTASGNRCFEGNGSIYIYIYAHCIYIYISLSMVGKMR